jgi:hypothetical protein
MIAAKETGGTSGDANNKYELRQITRNDGNTIDRRDAYHIRGVSNSRDANRRNANNSRDARSGGNTKSTWDVNSSRDSGNSSRDGCNSRELLATAGTPGTSTSVRSTAAAGKPSSSRDLDNSKDTRNTDGRNNVGL